MGINKLFCHRNINFDKNALTMPTKHVMRTLRKIYYKGYNNPSSTYLDGQRASEMVEKARLKIAKALSCNPDEIFFTSCASESNSFIAQNFNLALDLRSHHSLMSSEKFNFDSKKKNVSAFPLIVSETGHCLLDEYDIEDGKLYFLDITQAIGKIDINLHDLYRKYNDKMYITFTANSLYNYKNKAGVILASASGQKIGGIPGAGILYIKKEFQEQVKPLIYGSQENGLRGGTLNVPAIVCLGEAVEEACQKIYANNSKIYKIIYRIMKGISKNIDGKVEFKTNNNVINITFKNLLATTAVSLFDKYGINVSAGSACNSGSEEPSLAYIGEGYTDDEAMKTIRISVDSYNTIREAKKFVKVLKKIIDNYDI